MATMKQIADLAGVSRGTVDRVLNNRGIVNEETARKVRRIAESLNYTPSIAARSLAAIKRGIKLLYIIPDPERGPFFRKVLEGVLKKAEELSEYGVTVEIAKFGLENLPEIEPVISGAISSGISGVALIAPSIDPFNAAFKTMRDHNIPFVAVNIDSPESGRLAYVGSDVYRSGAAGAGLVRTMSRPGANVVVLESLVSMEQRLNLRSRGFFETMAAESPEINIRDVIPDCDDDYETYALTKSYLASHPDTDVVFVNGAGVYGACRAIENIPREKRPKLICYDLTAQMEPMLKNGVITATICQQPAMQATKPLDILFDYIALGIKPAQDKFFTSTEIIIKENYF